MFQIPIALIGLGAPARAASSWKIATWAGLAPRPPHSTGQPGAIQPPSWSRDCQARAASTRGSEPGPAAAPALMSSVRAPAIQARSSRRNAASEGASVKSTAGTLIHASLRAPAR